MNTTCLFSYKKGFAPLSWFLRIFQGGKSHCAIVHHLSNGKKIVSEFIGSGFRLILYSEWIKHNIIYSSYDIKIKDNDFDFYKTMDEVRADLEKDHGVKIGSMYAHIQLLFTGLDQFFIWIGLPELRMKINGPSAQICTEWVARFYSKYGKWTGDSAFDTVTLIECEKEIAKIGKKNG